MMDSTLHSSALRGLRQNICIRDTQTNMEESEHEDKQDKQGDDSDQPRQNKELVPKRGAVHQFV